jgi:hypothetical protein
MNRYMLVVRSRRTVTEEVEEVYYVDARSLLEATADLEGAMEDGTCTPVSETVLETFSFSEDPETVRVELIAEVLDEDEVDVDSDDFGAANEYFLDEPSDMTVSEATQEPETLMGLPTAVYAAPGESYAPIMVTVVSPDEHTTEYLNGAPVAVAQPEDGYNFIQTFEYPVR